MFASFFSKKSRRPSETTPLLAAINRYRRRQNGEDSESEDEQEGVAQYDGDEDDEDEDRQRDGPLLPVFSAEVLGTRRIMLACLLVHGTDNIRRSHTHLQHHARHSHNPRSAMRNHAVMGPAALPASVAISRQAHPAADSLRRTPVPTSRTRPC